MRHDLSDAELVVRVRRDPQALEQLYRRHVRALTGYAVRRCPTPEDVADLVAMTFLAVLESADQFDPERGDALPWMLGIASHLLIDRARSAAREREMHLRVVGSRALDDDGYAELESRIDAARQNAALEAALQALSRLDREAILLVDHDEMAQKDAAQVMGLSPTAFRMRLMRARRSLRKAISSTNHEDGNMVTARTGVPGEAQT